MVPSRESSYPILTFSSLPNINWEEIDLRYWILLTFLGYKLNISKEAKDFIAEKGYDIQFGARPLKRAIQKYIEDELSEILIQNSVKEGQTINLGFDKKNEKLIPEVK